MRRALNQKTLVSQEDCTGVVDCGTSLRTIYTKEWNPFTTICTTEKAGDRKLIFVVYCAVNAAYV